MWNWSHFQEEGWADHTIRSLKFVVLLSLAAGAMLLHTILPFWQQPKALRREEVACKLCEGLEINHE